MKTLLLTAELPRPAPSLLREWELHPRLEVLYVNPFVTKWDGLYHPREIENYLMGLPL